MTRGRSQNAPTKLGKKVGHIINVFSLMMCPIVLTAKLSFRSTPKTSVAALKIPTSSSFAAAQGIVIINISANLI